MSQISLLAELIAKDSLFASLFNGAADIQEAIKVASLYGLHLSMSDVTTFRKELPDRKKLITISPLNPQQPSQLDGQVGLAVGDIGSLGAGECHGFGDGCPH